MLAGVALFVFAAVFGALMVVAVPGETVATGSGTPAVREMSLPAAGRDPAASATVPPNPRLEALLKRIDRAWHPEEKLRLMAEAARLADRYEVPLEQLLASRSHPRLRQAIELTGAMQLASLGPVVVSLAARGPRDARAPAILASEQLGACTTEHLAGYLEESEPIVLLAALEVCAARSERPLPQVFALLGHGDPAVRRAAVAAVPPELDAISLNALVDAARSAPDGCRVDAVRAVGRVQRVAASEAFLVDSLRAADAAVRDAALTALSISGQPLQRSSDVWRFAIDPFGEPAERARALLCLERSGPIDVGEIRQQLPVLGPFLRYFAARCLVTAGDLAGVEALIRILEEADDSARDGDEILYATRRLLSDLSRRSHETDVAAWRRWFGGLSGLTPRPLAPPPLQLTDRATRSR